LQVVAVDHFTLELKGLVVKDLHQIQVDHLLVLVMAARVTGLQDLMEETQGKAVDLVVVLETVTVQKVAMVDQDSLQLDMYLDLLRVLEVVQKEQLADQSAFITTMLFTHLFLLELLQPQDHLVKLAHIISSVAAVVVEMVYQVVLVAAAVPVPFVTEPRL
tara:strand:+ start:923 stop:1405 length:483 start_codon:yes stop_codon:yes gene_type:complete